MAAAPRLPRPGLNPRIRKGEPMEIPRMRLCMLFLIISFIFTGCASTRTRMMVDGMKPLMQKMHEATSRNDDLELVRDAMPSLLLQLDGFIEASPENPYLLANAAEAYMGYAFLFVEENDRDRARGLYFKAKEYALRSLKLNKAFAEGFAQDDIGVFARSLQSIDEEDIGSLYIATNAWLQYIGVSFADDSSVLDDLPKVEAMIDRALEIDDTYYHGGLHALLGVWYISKPEMFGGQPDQAQFHFREAFEISESKYLLWQYLYARYYAFEMKDRALFVSTLEKILAAPDDIYPEEAFANKAVKMKAATLLEQTDDFFMAEPVRAGNRF